MRVWRGIRRGVLVIILVLPTGALGTFLALGWTPPGRRFAARLVEHLITERVAGRVAIGAIEGNLIDHIILRQVAIHDSLGTAVIVAERIEASYDVLKLFAGQELVFNHVTLDSAIIHLVAASHGGQWNYQRVFRASTSKSTNGTAPPPLIQLTDVTLRHISLRVDVPTTPKPPSPPTSRNATPSIPSRFETGPDGPVQVYTAEGLDAQLSLMRISTPKNDPLLVKIQSLSATLSDPALTIRALQGDILQAADSLRFTFQRAALPASVLRGGGVVRWPRDTVLWDFALTMDTVDLKDLRWISPDFPDWQGRGHVVALSQNGSRTAFRIEQLRLGNGRASAAGSLTAITDLSRGLGWKDLNLSLADVPLALARPYLDTLPFAGTLTGRLTADGFFDSMRLGGDLNFTDALVAGLPRSHLVMDGLIHFGGADGAVFEEFRLNESSIDLGTVHYMVPSVVLPGWLALSGRLDGAWNNVTFNGTAEHVTAEQARSRLVGRVGLDSRDTLLAVDIDGNFDQLSFDALRSGYPGIQARGGLTGHFALHGRIDSLTIDAALSGDIGTIHAAGNLRAAAPHFGSDSLVLDFARLNAEALLGRWGSTAFNGHAVVRGEVDSAGTPRGTAVMTIDPSRIGTISFDGAQVQLRADSGLVMIDTLQVELPEGWIDVRGSLGLDSTHAGTLSIDAGFRSLTPYDSLVRAHLGFSPDTLLPKALNGTVHGTFTVTGSLANPSIDGMFQARGLVLDQWHIAGIAADIRADLMGRRGLDITADGDSLGYGAQLIEHTRVGLSGRLDSLRYAIDGQMYRTHFATLGSWLQTDSSASGRVDSLALNNPGQQWRLVSPVRVAWADARPVLSDTLRLQTVDGGADLTLSGSLPGNKPGELSVSVVGLDIHDLLSQIQHDSSAIGGIASADFRLGGTSDAPTLHGSAAVTGPTIGDMRIPLVRATFDYQDQRLRSQVAFWQMGDPVLQADLSLPLNLAFSAAGDRKLPGAIDITAKVDSADLSLFEAFTSSVRSARGMLNLNMRATGSWKSPRLDGVARIDRGGLILPDLGVEYREIEGRIRFTGDSMVVDTLQMRSDGGQASAGGFIRFEQLVTPTFGLDIYFNEFLAIDEPGYLTARPTGSLSLRGPMGHPVLTGNLALSNSVLYYADIVNKTLIDLEDPAFADLVDTVAIRQKGIGASFQNRFLTALRIDTLRLRVNQEVWLRSPEANILLTSEGDVIVSKPGKLYDIQGQFNATRGTYTYSFQNVVNKEFKIDHGKVIFLGTHDLNATLDLAATHTVHTDDEGDVVITAEITGEIQAPHLKLTSTGRNISEIDLLSLLIFNQRAYRVSVNQNSATILAQAAATSLVSSTLNQEFFKRTGLGVQFTIFEAESGLSLTQQFGARLSLSGNFGLCRTSGVKTVGISSEYRLGGGFRLQSSIAPVQSCMSGRAGDILRLPNLYQYGVGLFWKRDY